MKKPMFDIPSVPRTRAPGRLYKPVAKHALVGYTQHPIRLKRGDGREHAYALPRFNQDGVRLPA